MLNLNHNTTDSTIEAQNRTELAEVLVAAGMLISVVNKMTKDERVVKVKEMRDELKSREEVRAAKAEAARLAQLEIDKNNETFNAVKQAYLICLTERQDAAKRKIANIQAQIAGGEWFNVMSTMTNYMEDVMEADQTARALNCSVEYLTAQTTEPTHTMEQFVMFVSEHAAAAMHRVLDSSEYQHRSTGVLRNLEGEREFKVLQQTAKFLRNAVKSIKSDLEGTETDPQRMASRRVYAW